MVHKHKHRRGSKQPTGAGTDRSQQHGRGNKTRPNAGRAGSHDLWLFGTHAVEAALKNPERKILRLLATPEAAKRIEATGVPAARLATLEPADRAAIDVIVGDDAVHQGIAAHVAPLPDLAVEDVIAARTGHNKSVIVALDHVTDPHNVGAILRSAAAFGATALVVTKHNAPEETGVLAKSASGALEHVPIVRATNLSRAIETLQQDGFWVVGLDASGDSDIDTLDLPEKCVLVLGAEGEGVRPGVRKVCDFMARLPMTGRMESLNVSNAAAIALFEWQRQKRGD